MLVTQSALKAGGAKVKHLRHLSTGQSMHDQGNMCNADYI